MVASFIFHLYIQPDSNGNLAPLSRTSVIYKMMYDPDDGNYYYYYYFSSISIVSGIKIFIVNLHAGQIITNELGYALVLHSITYVCQASSRT